MNHETIIKEVCAKVFKISESKIHLNKRLMGGMSNYTYVIDVDGTLHTFRIPGKNAEQFVDRDIEAYHLKLIEPLKLNNETIYTDIENGYKIAKYIEGKPLHELDPLNYLDAASKVLKTIHQSRIESKYDYAPFDRLEKYEKLVKGYDHQHTTRYYSYKNTLMSYKDFLDQFDKTLTHGDAQISNFVVQEDALRLMDWEFTGMNDPYYDIACFGNNNFDHALALLPVYLGHEPTDDEHNRLHLWRVFQCLQWHNVALYKAFIGLSKDLSVDFKKVAAMYLDKAEALIANLK